MVNGISGKNVIAAALDSRMRQLKSGGTSFDYMRQQFIQKTIIDPLLEDKNVVSAEFVEFEGVDGIVVVPKEPLKEDEKFMTINYSFHIPETTIQTNNGVSNSDNCYTTFQYTAKYDPDMDLE